ncbi:hypothetical protein RRG08_020871 [Elysia crispata]|uniref:Uncharacterized protein n=1 Tax=Elysia crispata TaxID=231223 RepID=A0AAE0XUS0_9GAST|nr:hypothetical protein RRG08_020871 [Elysia crispata]
MIIGAPALALENKQDMWAGNYALSNPMLATRWAQYSSISVNKDTSDWLDGATPVLMMLCLGPFGGGSGRPDNRGRDTQPLDNLNLSGLMLVLWHNFNSQGQRVILPWLAGFLRE